MQMFISLYSHAGEAVCCAWQNYIKARAWGKKNNNTVVRTKSFDYGLDTKAISSVQHFQYMSTSSMWKHADHARHEQEMSSLT